ncbi:acyltransferase [Xenorhabdus sp. 18]|uniref:acyltransferase n=1 Tax=Xenorhabdus doucetiae TaxID=351671 RepID=UPI0019A72884|nr:acyltransferase [Xenorhabdus sp. 18]MBD2795651.1 acyltransferase [Xenorhabdus sp. 18]
MIKLFYILTSLTYRSKNKLLNIFISFLYRKKINIDWRCSKILNHEKIIFGKNFSSGQGTWIQPINAKSKIVFGDDVSISDWSHITALDTVVIGSGCLIGSKVIITDHSHGYTEDLENEFIIRPNERPLVSKGSIFIEENVWIGDGAVILGNIRIGKGAIIAAQSVVNTDVPPFTMVGGIPAKIIKKK